MNTSTEEQKPKFEFYVAGVQHHELHTITGGLMEDDELDLEPEPTNKYDKNAIKIKAYDCHSKKYTMVGYVPGKISASVSAFLTIAENPVCKVTKFQPNEKPWNQLKVSISDYIDDQEIDEDSDLELDDLDFDDTED